MAYVPKITRARFVLGPFSAEDMAIIGHSCATASGGASRVA